jgi:lysozyme
MPIHRFVVTFTAVAAVFGGATAWAAPAARSVDHVPRAGFDPAAAPGLSAIAPDAGGRTWAGIDVSHWQGSIDFSQVKSAGIRFVFAKATEGQTFDDPNFATYRADAEAQGLLVGAYHFADPDTSSNDATIEADHFASVYQPKSGELVPVLDIENSGGLSVSALTAWVQTFLDRVTADDGVKPMIYTGPYFWRTYMGDTTQFADEGYRVLWIANWGVPSPDVPAQDWGGAGWTVWQWSDCGSIPGISGCVDQDTLAKGRLKKIVVP